MQPARSRLTGQIVVAMVVGIFVGLLLNFLGTFAGEDNVLYSFLNEYGTNGILAVVGQAFLRLLTVLVVPLVFVSLVCGTAALKDLSKLGRIGLRTLVLYLATTAIAISLGIALCELIRPGSGLEVELPVQVEAKSAPSLVETISNLFPRNVVGAMAEGNMLQLIIFSLLFGISLTLAGAAGERVLSAFTDCNEVILKLVGIVMWISPYGVFALVARTFAAEGFEAFGPLAGYFLVVLAALLFHGSVVYGFILKFVGGLNPLPFFKKMRQVQLFAFSTASSNATIPVTLTTLEKRMGVSNSIASFTVPLGATINMDGTAIMQGVATVFIAQAYSIPLGWMDLVAVVLTATLASIGTAGVPGVGLVMLGMVLAQVGLPVEGIALIVGIDRLLDMVRTAVNVTGDAMVGCLVAKSEGELNMDQYRESLRKT